MPIPTVGPAMSVKMNTNDRMVRIAMWPPVMFAASRIVSANGRTSIPSISIGTRMIASAGDPGGARFFQC